MVERTLHYATAGRSDLICVYNISMLVYTLHLTGYIYYQLMIQDKYTVALYHLH